MSRISRYKHMWDGSEPRWKLRALHDTSDPSARPEYFPEYEGDGFVRHIIIENASVGSEVIRRMLANGVEIEHACEKSCACTTCHVIVREGFNSLEASSEEEDDLLDKAWGLEPQSRLSCQARVSGSDLVIEIPKYTINMVKEGH